MQAFASNSNVAFGDVNLSDEQIRGTHNPGAGGWPTIKYFNKETGYEGKPYVQKTSDAMCTELGNDKYMTDYIEEAGNTYLCDAVTQDGCDEKQSKYAKKFSEAPLDKVEKELDRLNSMAGGAMKEDLKAWLQQRINILSQFKKSLTVGKEEL